MQPGQIGVAAEGAERQPPPRSGVEERVSGTNRQLCASPLWFPSTLATASRFRGHPWGRISWNRRCRYRPYPPKLACT